MAMTDKPNIPQFPELTFEEQRHIYRLNVETNEVEEVDLSAP